MKASFGARIIAILLLVPLCAATALVARAQTSQASASAATVAPVQVIHPWTRAVRAFATALVNPTDAVALTEALPPVAVVRRFDKDEAQDRLALHAAAAGAVVVSVLSYTDGPSTVATDLALDIREAEFLPESIRNQFSMEGDAAVRRANETAAQWVNGALQPGVQQPVALVALWHPSRGTMTFVLLKGRETAAGEHRVTYVVYGDVGHIVG